MAKKPDPRFKSGFITAKAVLSFPHLAAPDNGKFGQGRYKGQFIFDAATLEDSSDSFVKNGGEKTPVSMMDFLRGHAKDYFGTTENITYSITDGAHNHSKGYKGYEGKKFISPWSKQQPMLLDQYGQNKEGTEFSAGNIVRANITAMAYESSEKVIEVIDGQRVEKVLEKKGVTLLLNGVKFEEEGTPLGGGGSAKGGFDFDEMPATEDDGGF